MTSVAKSLEQSRPLHGQTPDGCFDVEKIRAFLAAAATL